MSKQQFSHSSSVTDILACAVTEKATRDSLSAEVKTWRDAQTSHLGNFVGHLRAMFNAEPLVGQRDSLGWSPCDWAPHIVGAGKHIAADWRLLVTERCNQGPHSERIIACLLLAAADGATADDVRGHLVLAQERGLLEGVTSHHLLNSLSAAFGRAIDREQTRLFPGLEPSSLIGEETDGAQRNRNSRTVRVKVDGPFEADGFRFQGAEVRFAKARKQLDLVLALWDRKKRKPSPPRQVDDVMEEVYGMNHKTEEATFRKLCSQTRDRLTKSHCLITIRVPTPAFVELHPVG